MNLPPFSPDGARFAIRWRSIRPLAVLCALPDYIRALIAMVRHRPTDPIVPIVEPGLDLVTVVFRDELDLLALQARSFARYLDPRFDGRIIVLVNDLRWAKVMARIETGVLPQYGHWRDRVTVRPFHTLIGRLDPANGWILQQALKLACGRLIARPHYVVFDAKNHLIAPTPTSHFVDADGVAHQAVCGAANHLPRHHDTCARYFGVDPVGTGSRNFVPMTPFVLHTQSVRDLLDDLATREGRPIADFFCTRRFISEFLLYGSYLAAQEGGIAALYKDAPSGVVTIWPDGDAGAAIAEAVRNEALCFGAHRNFIKQADGSETGLLESFWRGVGLLGPRERLRGLARRGDPSADPRPSARHGLHRAASFAVVASAVATGSIWMLFGDHPLAPALTSGTVALGLAAAAVRLRGRLGNLLLSAAILAGGTGAVWGLASALKQDIHLQGESDLFAKGGPLGWTLRPGAHRVVKTGNDRTIYDVVYGIDGGGRRITQAAADGPAVAFLGDSFTFGEGVADSQTLPQAVSDLLGRRQRVVNLGVPAYSPAQVLRGFQLGLYDDVLKPAKVFFMLTASWHADRVACLDEWVVGAPRYVLRNDRVESDGQCPPLPTPGPVLAFVRQTAPYKLLFAGKLPFVGDADIATYIEVVAETVKVAKARYGVPLKLLYLRNAGYLRYTSYSDDDIMMQLRAGGADVLEMTLQHEGKDGVAIPGDGHPNGEGNRRRARMLVEAVDRTSPGLLAR